MTGKQRIVNHILGKEVDHIPSVGGWMLGVRNLAQLADLTVEEYLADPQSGVIRANRRLGASAIVPPIIPRNLDAIRDSHVEQESFASVEPEALKDRGDAIADTEAKVLAAKFDETRIQQHYLDDMAPLVRQLGDLALIPTYWGAPATFSLYFEYGYEAFLAAVALYPEAVERIYWESGVLARARNRVFIRVCRMLGLPPICFCGDDICNNSGPMVSPVFLRKAYWPHAKYALEPFVEENIRLIHHCDGNVMPLVDDMLAAGFSGFQGFQYECGVDPYALAGKPTHSGRPLMLAGLSVTRTLPFGSVDDVIEEVEYCLDYTDGGQGLLLFTSNVTGVEVPPDNLRAAYGHIRKIKPDATRPESAKRRTWPYAAKGIKA